MNQTGKSPSKLHIGIDEELNNVVIVFPSETDFLLLNKKSAIDLAMALYEKASFLKG